MSTDVPKLGITRDTEKTGQSNLNGPETLDSYLSLYPMVSDLPSSVVKLILTLVHGSLTSMTEGIIRHDEHPTKSSSLSNTGCAFTPYLHSFPLGADTGLGPRESAPVGPMWALNLTKLVQLL